MRREALAWAFLGVLLALGSGCSDRTTNSTGVITPGPTGEGLLNDAGTVSPADRVRQLCSPGTARCIDENSPFVDRCARDGESLERQTCPQGEVCRNRRCVPFACSPGTDLCVGDTRATCDPTGLAVIDAEACAAPSVCEGGRCVNRCQQARQSGSYIGCDYVALRLTNFYERSEADAFPFGIVLANPSPFVATTATLTGPDGDAITSWPRRRLQLIAGDETEIGSAILRPDGTEEPLSSIAEVEIPPGSAAVLLPSTATRIVEVRTDQPVAAYQFSPYCCNSTFTNDASLLFPVETWSDRYRGIGYPSVDVFASPYFTLYSSERRTITLGSEETLLANGFPVNPGGEIELQPGEPLYIEGTGSDFDLSGVELRGDGPFAAFSGHPCTYVPRTQAACDHLEEQLPPAGTLGTRYLLPPIRERNRDAESEMEGIYWRVAADETSTFTIDPPLEALELLPHDNPATPSCRSKVDANGSVSLAEGESCEFGTALAASLSSSGAVAVAGVISGQQSTGLTSYGSNAGDPALFVMPPAQQFRDQYVFIAPPTYAVNFVSVAIRRGEAVVLDGRNIEEEFRLERQFVGLDGDVWELFTVPIEAGLHTMRSESTFAILVYAYDDYVSYAFVGGLDLLPKGE